MPALKQCSVKAAVFQGVGTLMTPGQRALRLRKMLAQEEQNSYKNPLCCIKQKRRYVTCRISEVGVGGQRIGFGDFPVWGLDLRAQTSCSAHTVGAGHRVPETPHPRWILCSASSLMSSPGGQVCHGVSDWLSLGYMPCCNGAEKTSISL